MGRKGSSRGWGLNRIRKEIVAVDNISLSVPTGQAIANGRIVLDDKVSEMRLIVFYY
ncbi:MAG: hypothetical protein SAK29_32430 [Scytonema sp. PMC 1069.18]|nr:hypothetical protein [Scytonema sp. PMC 1069.18]MEC4887752.1 hypothetical protein [Scytonema sp. PMC 1070.18]